MKTQTAFSKIALKNIIATEPYTIRAEVALEALGYDDNPITFFSDLLQHGCFSGVVGRLIYYTDTHKFYDKHYAEIEALRFDYEQQTEECLMQKLSGDLKTGSHGSPLKKPQDKF